MSRNLCQKTIKTGNKTTILFQYRFNWLSLAYEAHTEQYVDSI